MPYIRFALLESGQVVVNVHDPAICEDQPCAIHHPSDHPLKNAPRRWMDRMVWRTCEHGVDHPDFDSVVFQIVRYGGITVKHICCLDTCCGLPDWIDIA